MPMQMFHRQTPVHPDLETVYCFRISLDEQRRQFRADDYLTPITALLWPLQFSRLVSIQCQDDAYPERGLAGCGPVV
jgi:hypothetical protein